MERRAVTALKRGDKFKIAGNLYTFIEKPLQVWETLLCTLQLMVNGTVRLCILGPVQQ